MRGQVKNRFSDSQEIHAFRVVRHVLQFSYQMSHFCNISLIIIHVFEDDTLRVMNVMRGGVVICDCSGMGYNGGSYNQSSSFYNGGQGYAAAAVLSQQPYPGEPFCALVTTLGPPPCFSPSQPAKCKERLSASLPFFHSHDHNSVLKKGPPFQPRSNPARSCMVNVSSQQRLPN